MDKARNAPVFLLVLDGLLLKGKIFWLILFNTEDKHRNGDSQDIIFCPTKWAYFENRPLLPHLSKSRLISENSPLLPHLSRTWAYF